MVDQDPGQSRTSTPAIGSNKFVLTENDDRFMSSTQKRWIIYIGLAIIAIFAWLRLSYPSFSLINLSISKEKAFATARAYLRNHLHVKTDAYQTATILFTDSDADRYLQKTIGFQKELEFLAQHHFDLFAWHIRFFQEGEKEEYFISVSAATGKVISFAHILKDTAPRPETTAEDAQALAEKFLSGTFAINFQDYLVKEKIVKKYDHRTDYSFSWQKKNVSIPWSRRQSAGTGKLLMKIKISGNEILYFDVNVFDIPNGFRRFIDNAKQSGNILTNIFSIFYYLLMMAATYFIVVRRQHLILQAVQPFYVSAGLLLFFLLVLFQFNNIQNILFDYPTTFSFNIYFSELFLGILTTGIFLAVMMVVPAMAGEAIAQENARTANGFMRYIRSTFLSRHAALMIILGYLIAVILLGLQSWLFKLGQTYCGVWLEKPYITQTSSALWPFLTVLIVGFRASLCEETVYRLFGIEYGKKMFKNIFLACLVTSIIWGFGHSHYQIFPSWFRGIEVSLLGLVLSFFYVHYGILPVIVGHYIFDTFWGGAGFLLGKAQPFDLITCLVVIGLPLIMAIVAFVCNRSEAQTTKKLKFKEAHRYNLRILHSFLSDARNTEGKSTAQIREELIRAEWDIAVIDEALREMEKGR